MWRPMIPLLLASLLLLSLDAVAQTSHAWIWVVPIGGPENDVAGYITLDSTGHAYVTGYFNETMTFADTTLTAERYDDLYLTKFAPDGRVLWVRMFGGSGVDMMRDVDSDGDNVFMLGSFTDDARFDTMRFEGPRNLPTSFVACYSTEGELRWVRTFPAGMLGTGVLALATDGKGNVYLTGNTPVATTWGEWPIDPGSFVLKLDRNGTITWGSMLGDVHAVDLTFDEKGRLFVTGGFSKTVDFGGFSLTSRTETRSDQFLIGYDGDGPIVSAVSLVSRYNGIKRVVGLDGILSIDVVDGLVVTCGDFSDTIIIGDQIYTSADREVSFFAACYDLDGRSRWGLAIHPDDGRSQVCEVALGPDGKTYLAGQFQDTMDFSGIEIRSKGSSDLFLAALDAEGNLDWIEQGSSTYNEIPWDLALMPGSGLWMVGSAQKSPEPTAFGPLRFEGAGRNDGFVTRLDVGIGTSHRREEPAMGEILSLAPNPATDLLTISYTIDAPSTASIELFDALGRSVVSVAPQESEEGSYAETIDVSRLVPGSYHARVRIVGTHGESTTWSRRVTIVR